MIKSYEGGDDGHDFVACLVHTRHSVIHSAMGQAIECVSVAGYGLSQLYVSKANDTRIPGSQVSKPRSHSLMCEAYS